MGNKVTFFYDQQLEQASNTVRIRNTGKGTGKDADKNDEILRSFFVDDFHLTLSNQWSTGDSTIVKSVVDAAQNFITGRTGRVVNNYLKKGIDAATSGMDERDEGYKLLSGLRGGLETLSKYQNSAFFTADDFYKTFKGTTLTFPISLSISLVSDSQSEDIFDRLKRLLSVSIGDYSTFMTFVGIQNAPNGFDSGGYDITSTAEIKGSVNVIYGDPQFGGFTLTNMLISNIHCTFSKTRVEIKVGDSSVYRPLYIDIAVMLEPAKKFTKDDLYANLNLGPVEKKTVPPRIEPKNNPSPKEKTESDKIKTSEKVKTEKEKSIIKINSETDNFLKQKGFVLQTNKGPITYQTSFDLSGNPVITFIGESDSQFYLNAIIEGTIPNPGGGGFSGGLKDTLRSKFGKDKVNIVTKVGSYSLGSGKYY